MSTLTTDLKRLGEVKAPAGFADRLLAHVGMSDSYARFDTVLGAVYVAWNRQGISAAARDASADEFEARVHKEVGRQLVAAGPPPDLAAKIRDELEGRHRLRYQGVKTTKVCCYPTCHTGRHALEKNIVWLHDEASARAAGFRPCKVCRPGAQLSA